MENNKTMQEMNQKKSKKIRVINLKFIIIILLFSLFISFTVKSLVETRGQKIIEDLNNNSYSTTQPSTEIIKGRGFEDEKTIKELNQAIKRISARCWFV